MIEISKVIIPEDSKQYQLILDEIENASSKEELENINDKLSEAEKLIKRLRHRIKERKTFL